MDIYIYIYIWKIYIYGSPFHLAAACGSITLTLELIGKDGSVSTQCHSCRFACQQMVLKIFPGPDYLRSKDGLVIWLTISSCYDSIPLILEFIGRDGGLSTLCHNCKFGCQLRVLKTFPDPGYLRFKDGVA